MSLNDILADKEWSAFPAIAQALAAMDSATSKQEYGAAQDQLFHAQLAYDLHVGIDDMWNQYERDTAIKIGLIAG